MSNKINELISGLRAGGKTVEIEHDASSSLMHVVHVPIPTNLFSELKAMSAVFDVDSNDLAGELLAIALKEAIDAHPQDELERLREIREVYEKEQIKQSMDKAQYNSGGT